MIRINWFRKPYIYLLVLSGVFLLLYLGVFFGLSESNPLLPWFGRLTASVLGAYLTAVLVDGTFREEERRRKENIRETAANELSLILRDQKRQIEELYKAAASHPPDEDEIETLRDLVESDSFEEIRMLDLNSTCPRANRPNTYTWIDLLYDNKRNLDEEVNAIIKKYGIYLESDFIEDLHSLTDQSFFHMVEGLRSVSFDNGERPLLLHNHTYSDLTDYITLLSDVCDHIDEGFNEHELILLYSEDTSPSIGASRFSDEIPVEAAVREYMKKHDEMLKDAEKE